MGWSVKGKGIRLPAGGILLVLCLLFPVAAHALGCDGKTIPDTDDSRPVRVLALEYPMGISFEQWLERTDSQVTCRLFERLKRTPDFVLMPFRRAFAEMAADNADIMVGTDYIFEPDIRCRMKMIIYRHYRILAYYYATEPHRHEPTRLQDFNGKRLVTGDLKLFKRLTGLVEVEVMPIPEVANKFTMLRLNRADYALEEAGQIGKIPEARSLPGDTGRFFSVSTPFSTAYTGLVVNVNRPGMVELADQLIRELDRLRDEDSFRTLVGDDPSYLDRRIPTSILLSTYPEKIIGTDCTPQPPPIGDS
ncbi:MAG TPA: hypothetical protein PLB10_02365 [Thiolinea sp.]|nr:hypothetical protein [Thiolinea sp.]